MGSGPQGLGSGLLRDGTLGLEFAFGDGGFDFGVDFRAEQKREAGDVEPGEQNDDRAQRAVGDGVTVEKVEINAQGNGGEEPEQDADGGAGCEPTPDLVLDIGREVVDGGESRMSMAAVARSNMRCAAMPAARPNCALWMCARRKCDEKVPSRRQTSVRMMMAARTTVTRMAAPLTFQ